MSQSCTVCSPGLAILGAMAMFRQSFEFWQYNVVFWCGCVWWSASCMESEKRDTAQREVFSGWKEIARYLGKGIRTVQRYERELSLPVRRLSGNRAGSVLATKADLDSWIRLSATTAQESFDRSTLAVQEYLSSEIAKGLRERAQLHAQMMALRKEVKTSVQKVHESILKLRHQLDETRRRQDSMASVIRGYSKARGLLAADGKHRKPN